MSELPPSAVPPPTAASPAAALPPLEYASSTAWLRPRKRNPVVAVLSRLPWLGAGVLILLLAMLPAFVFGKFLYLFVPVIALLVMSGVRLLMRTLRRNRQAAVLQALAAAVRLNLPLPAMLAGVTAQRDAAGRAAARVGALLAGGASLQEALGEAFPAMRPAALATLGAAERMGQLQQMMPRVLAEALPSERRAVSQQLLERLYPLMTVPFLLTACGFVTIFITPKFLDIAADFRTPLSTLFIFNAETLPQIMLPMAVVCCIMFFWLLERDLRCAIGIHQSPLTGTQLLRRTRYALPGWAGWERATDLAVVCSFLADVVGAGLPLSPAIGESARLHINPVLGRRLLRWRKMHDAGQSACDSARAANLPPLFVGALAIGDGRGTSAQTFSFLAALYRHRALRRQAWFTRAAYPAMLLGLGALVFLIVAPLIGMVPHVVRMALWYQY